MYVNIQNDVSQHLKCLCEMKQTILQCIPSKRLANTHLWWKFWWNYDGNIVKNTDIGIANFLK